jgi:serine/threonine protein kinase
MPIDVGIGATVGNYTIKSVLGRGGMSVVYVAEDGRLGRDVALKVMADELADSDAFRTRFDREAHLAASLEDPNIVPVYDAGEVDGVLYLAMRIIKGTDLRKVIAEEAPLDPDRVLSILRQVASALDAAHEAGLVHRDVKPGNILLSVRGGDEHAYLSDFGLTKHVSSKSGLTKTGQFMGTIDYVAPEQIRGQNVDGRTDQYSLGCVLYQCLAGDVPFAREQDLTVLVAHLEEDPAALTDIRPDLPEQIDGVIAQALAKRKEDRFESCSLFVQAARDALVLTPTAAGSVSVAPPLAPTMIIAPLETKEVPQPHPSFPPEAEPDVEAHPSFPPTTSEPETEEVASHPSLPPTTTEPTGDDELESHPSFPPAATSAAVADLSAAEAPALEPEIASVEPELAPMAPDVTPPPSGVRADGAFVSGATEQRSPGRRWIVILAVAIALVVTAGVIALLAGGGDGVQPAADIPTVTTPTTAPTTSAPPTVTEPVAVRAPLNVRATDASSTRVKLAWSAAPGGGDAVRFLVFRNGKRIGQTVETTFTDAGVAAGTTQTYRIVAVGEDGSEAASDPVKVEVPTAAGGQTTAPPSTSDSGTAPTGGGGGGGGCQNEFRNVCLD